MFNVIPPITSRNVGFMPQNNRISKPLSNLAPLKADAVSFTGIMPVRFDELHLDCMTSKFYLNKKSISSALEGASPEVVMHILAEEVGELLAKRMDFLGYTPKTKFGSSCHAVHDDFPKTLNLHEKGKNRDILQVDWTKEYNGIRKLIAESGHETEEAKEKLFSLFQKYKLMK